LHFGEDGRITVFTGKVEVGQGSRTELAMAAAEELQVPLHRVQLVMADTDLVPNDGITAGSRSTPSTVPAVRQAAAAARALREQSAAGKPDFDYRDLAKLDLRDKPIPAAKLLSPDRWQILGTPHGRTDARAIVTGGHRYPSDIQRPGMFYGCVLRPPSFGAKLLELDLKAAASVAGAKAVRDGEFAGCYAPTSFAARKAVAALKQTARWEEKSSVSHRELFAHLKQTADPAGRPPRIQTRGDLQQALADARQKVKAAYQVAFIQHAPMEPRSAAAEWTDGKLTVWTGTQNPHGVRDQLVQAFRLSPSKVRVIVPDTGGGFGGKHTADAAIEAAKLAKESGRPISLRWTRAEEFQHAYFRPAGLFEIEASLDSHGLLTAWDFHNYNAGTASMETPYRVANARHAFHYCDSPLREGSYRGIAATANNFARECFMDELAAAASQDPFQFRQANLEPGRLRNVLEAAAARFGWAGRGKGTGIACGTEKGSYVAACAEVDPNNGQPIVRRITMAYECGAILNPSNLRAQVEGSIIQGLGGALTEAMEFENGRVTNGLFRHYRVPRFKDVPPIEIVLLDRKDLPSAGAGETPIIAVAPAIANAMSHATGARYRAMPVRGLPKA
jgi:isoquinoline 1-oxidoreductase